MKSVGEPFSSEELEAFMLLATNENNDKDDKLDIQKLADLLIPPVKVETTIRKGMAPSTPQQEWFNG